MCIRIIGASNRRYAHIGDVIVVVINDVVPNMPLQRSEVVRAVIVRTCKELKRDNGMIIRYDDNAAVVIDQEGNPKGTRVFGAIARELRQFNFTKIVSLAPEIHCEDNDSFETTNEIEVNWMHCGLITSRWLDSSAELVVSMKFRPGKPSMEQAECGKCSSILAVWILQPSILIIQQLPSISSFQTFILMLSRHPRLNFV
ncbi:hypothetical protein E3N88_10275 [Mikania micrantha]|uniref:50S ribosomal protein L14, chloroplastic n=1 Tax=Mikania micrantha TaxID=192012 RepID=A0A5N6PC51_9ASTR|nr:hypothetical protein E3N88_10275 [Mikania micrantha]